MLFAHGVLGHRGGAKGAKAVTQRLHQGVMRVSAPIIVLERDELLLMHLASCSGDKNVQFSLSATAGFVPGMAHPPT